MDNVRRWMDSRKAEVGVGTGLSCVNDKKQNRFDGWRGGGGESRRSKPHQSYPRNRSDGAGPARTEGKAPEERMGSISGQSPDWPSSERVWWSQVRAGEERVGAPNGGGGHDEDWARLQRLAAGNNTARPNLRPHRGGIPNQGASAEASEWSDQPPGG